MTSAPFTLRLGVPEDALAIIDAHRAAVRGTAAEYYSPEIIEEWAPPAAAPERVDGFARAMAAGYEVVVVAAGLSNEILGFGSIVPSNNELRAVYVRSEYGRHGIGRAIFQRLETIARELGVNELQMDASINAEAFYKANGFVPEAVGQHPMPSGRQMACVRMRKRL